MKKLGVLTSGGDAPGMNAAIRAVVRTALGRGLKIAGIFHGYAGLLGDDVREIDSQFVGGIISHGGTVLRSGRCKEFFEPNSRALAAENLKKHEIDGIVVIGGDGSLRGALKLQNEHSVPMIGIPASIDNDISCSDVSIGFDTAVNTAVEAIDKVRDTAYSHERVFVVEVMGRRNGFIAVEAGLAGGAEAVLIPEIPFDLQEICDRLSVGHDRGKKSSIIVVAEGASSAAAVQEFIRDKTGYEVRQLVLGHMQRGGNPTAFDRVLATRLGAAAVQRLASGVTGEMVGLFQGKVTSSPLETVLSTERSIDSERLLLADLMAS
ncbi:MAG: ATP-dependent 6-phosphofructokinase [Fimbriimonadales bacterium]|nr:MAG: 6-phosphofructokinase [Armatimonadota bacterium]MBV6501964.1 ATP-dependent 6-phosphofructokinase [Fimbriimonadales bacterium]MCE7901009.1 6-phosphofructokinase [Armatimonadetes bacterium ATM1]MDL1929823.1 6-phosphofructokinase [Fimbriimonadia bacterium ATM]MBC6970866.1 6-phosphofructokinase [Armatimonadota bacterium]